MRIIKFVLLFLLLLFLFLTTSAVVAYIKIPDLKENQAILILGKGGEGHTASDLTDVIMLAYLNKNKNRISVISIPRDIWIFETRAKINASYYYGGFKMVSKSIKSITNIEISNVIVIDFDFFKEFIDAIGGIEVVVENSFVDQKFPIPGRENDLCGGDRTFACRYETLQFLKGKQLMNGETALKFVRSRNAKGDEGTDLAREKRQQKVVDAIKKKLTFPQILTSPMVIKNIYSVLSNNLKTDLDKNKAMVILKYLAGSKPNISYLNFPQELITASINNKKYDYQYVFIPKDGSWEPLQQWFMSNF